MCWIVADFLQSKLVDISRDFKGVLELRTEVRKRSVMPNLCDIVIASNPYFPFQVSSKAAIQNLEWKTWV